MSNITPRNSGKDSKPAKDDRESNSVKNPPSSDCSLLIQNIFDDTNLTSSVKREQLLKIADSFEMKIFHREKNYLRQINDLEETIKRKIENHKHEYEKFTKSFSERYIEIASLHYEKTSLHYKLRKQFKHFLFVLLCLFSLLYLITIFSSGIYIFLAVNTVTVFTVIFCSLKYRAMSNYIKNIESRIEGYISALSKSGDYSPELIRYISESEDIFFNPYEVLDTESVNYFTLKRNYKSIMDLNEEQFSQIIELEQENRTLKEEIAKFKLDNNGSEK